MAKSAIRAEIDCQLENAVAELEAACKQAAVNCFLLRHAGGLAWLFERPELAARLQAVNLNLKPYDYLRGAIINIDPGKLRAPERLNFPSSQDMDREHPLCDHDGLVARMKKLTDPHLALCLSGDIIGAVKKAKDRLSLEDIACTLVALGEYDRAVAFMANEQFDDSIRANVHFVMLLEKCRRGDEDCIVAVQRAKLLGSARLSVILALAGRLPWIGYPCSDL